MFSHWIWGIFNIQIQTERGHKLMEIICHIKFKDLLDIYKWVMVHSVCHCWLIEVLMDLARLTLFESSPSVTSPNFDGLDMIICYWQKTIVKTF